MSTFNTARVSKGDESFVVKSDLLSAEAVELSDDQLTNINGGVFHNAPAMPAPEPVFTPPTKPGVGPSCPGYL
jgi:hypothetical protein